GGHARPQARRGPRRECRIFARFLPVDTLDSSHVVPAAQTCGRACGTARTRLAAPGRPSHDPRGMTDPATHADPFTWFATWFEEAKRDEPFDPTAMALATVDASGRPSVRMVLLKGVDARGFFFVT